MNQRMNSTAQPIINEKLHFVIGLANEWKTQFDILPPIDFDFSVRNDALYMGENLLCPVDQIHMEGSFYDVESLNLALTSRDYVIIHIIWTPDNCISTHIELRSHRISVEHRD